MKKILVVLVSFLLIFLIVVSCSKTNPTTPQPTATATATQTGLFVERADLVQAQSSHGVGGVTAYFTLRYGNSGGSYVQGATIAIGTGTLVENTPGKYSLAFSNTADLTNVSVTISSLAGNANSSVVAPYDAYIFTPSSDGGNQSAAATMAVSWDYCATSCPLPQKVRLLLWRSSDSLIVKDTEYTPASNGEGVTLSIGTLPTMGKYI
jgi:hypothetical protein